MTAARTPAEAVMTEDEELDAWARAAAASAPPLSDRQMQIVRQLMLPTGTRARLDAETRQLRHSAA